MARNVTLLEIIEMVREEAGHSTSPVVSQADTNRIAQMIRRTQTRLYHDYAWPHLYTEVEETLNSGQRYYAYEAGIDPERIFDVYFKGTTGDWVKLEHGIVPTDYNSWDSEGGEEHSEVYKWQMRDNDIYEVWPAPDANTYTLKFTGMAKLPSLINNADRCVLDADMIALYVSAELLIRQKSPDAEYKMSLADQLYRRLRSAGQHRDMINYNGNSTDRRLEDQARRYAYGPKMV